MTGNAIFTFQTRPDGVVAVEDLCRPNCLSVTNDAEHVVKTMLDLGLDLRRVVYLDQLGVWDGLAVQDGKFAAFVNLMARTQDEAASMALATPNSLWIAGVPF